jgi:hypothetical protein
MSIKKISEDFYRGFSISVDGANIALVYSGAFKALETMEPDTATTARMSLQKLFASHGAVIGDLNTTPPAIKQLLGSVNIERTGFDFPTYLFPAPVLDSMAKIPCFDNCIWDTKAFTNVVATPLVELPSKLARNPREYMKKQGLPSDHVPIEVVLNVRADKVRILAYNVADPVLWAQHYPLAGEGFALDVASEQARIDKLFAQISEYVSQYDYVFLQEVPHALTVRLISSFECQTVDMQSEQIVENVSQLVLITKN